MCIEREEVLHLDFVYFFLNLITVMAQSKQWCHWYECRNGNRSHSPLPGRESCHLNEPSRNYILDNKRQRQRHLNNICIVDRYLCFLIEAFRCHLHILPAHMRGSSRYFTFRHYLAFFKDLFEDIVAVPPLSVLNVFICISTE